MGWVIPVAQLAVSAYGAYSSKKAGDKALKGQKGILAERLKQMKDAEWYRRQGQLGTAQAMKYYGGLLSGNRQRMVEQLQPELDQVNQGYQQAREKLMLQPRGGGRSAAMTDQIFKQQQDVNNLFIGGRRNAVDKLANLSGQVTNTGFGMANAGMGGAEGIMNNMWGIEQDQGRNAQGLGAGMMSGFEGLWNYYQNRQPSSGTNTSYQYGSVAGAGAGAGNAGAKTAAGAGAGPASSPPPGMSFFGSAIGTPTQYRGGESQPSVFRTSLLNPAKKRKPFGDPDGGY